MKKKENVRFKLQVTAYILSIFIVINPLLLLFSKKNSNKEPNTQDNIVATNPITNERKTYFELIDEITSNIKIEPNNIALPSQNEKCNYIDNIISSNDLYTKTNELITIIKNNSINYIANSKEYTLGFIDEIDNEHNQDKLKTQSILKDAISDILINSTSKDLCLLTSLKVVISYSNDFNGGAEYKNEDNLLVVYPNNKWEDIEYAIRLELNKIRINNCKCQDSTLFTYNTLNRAATLSELYNTNKTDIYVSNDDIKKEAIFLILGLFHDSYTIDDYYKAIFNNDIEALYKFCGANTEEDIYTLNKILYAMDNNISTTEYNYKFEIFRITINNLINYTINNKDFNLKNNLTIFKALKNLITNDSDQNIEELCNIYINFLSKHYKKTTSTIVNTLNSNEIEDYTIALYNICNKFEKSGTVNSFDLTYANNLIKDFPLLKQILILSIYKDYDNKLSNPLTLSKTRNI